MRGFGRTAGRGFARHGVSGSPGEGLRVVGVEANSCAVMAEVGLGDGEVLAERIRPSGVLDRSRSRRHRPPWTFIGMIEMGGSLGAGK
jgi:hypothetical protein